MKLYWLAAIAMGVPVWNFVGASQREWTAEGHGQQLPVTGICVKWIVWKGTDGAKLTGS